MEDYTARARLFGGNRMKLGVMAFNCSHGSTITTVPEAWTLNWPDTKEIVTKLVAGLSDDEITAVLRGNAIKLLQLDLEP